MQNKSWLRHSQRIAVRMLEKMDELSMTVNKHQHVRAALCWQTEIAHLARQHNDANVLVMPGRFLTLAEADAIMGEFLGTPFEGGRHMRRIEKIPCSPCVLYVAHLQTFPFPDFITLVRHYIPDNDNQRLA